MSRENRITSRESLSACAACVQELIGQTSASLTPPHRGWHNQDIAFGSLALDLFCAQYSENGPYRQFCQARGVSVATVLDWQQIPAVPAAAFKEVELSCLPAEKRTHWFASSRTTGQQSSRHFHHRESLALYEASLTTWFDLNLLGLAPQRTDFLLLSPPPEQVPHSSLVHMFETVRRRFGSSDSVYAGTIDADEIWRLDPVLAVQWLRQRASLRRPTMLLGTAYLYVNLLDYLTETGSRLTVPNDSRILETGGYKGRSRSVPKGDLYQGLSSVLGIPLTHIVSEYGMCELSSQAYDYRLRETCSSATGEKEARCFQFPPWARARVVSPESGEEVEEGDTGLIQVFDLANVWSVMAIQTEDLGIRRGAGFHLLGRATLAEPRGCSLMSV